jgi:hypothetical protein
MASGYSDMMDSQSSHPERDDETLEIKSEKVGRGILPRPACKATNLFV